MCGCWPNAAMQIRPAAWARAAAPTPPIWTGSVGPRSLAVTGRQADGWIPGHAADWLSDRYRSATPWTSC